MNERITSASAFTALAAYVTVGILLIINFPRDGYDAMEKRLYAALIIAYFIVIGLVMLAIIRHRLYIFEPFTIITVLYVGIFILRPVQDLFTHSVSYAGKSYVAAGFKATIFFTAGYIAFYIGYYMKKKYTEKEQQFLKPELTESVSLYVTMWVVFFVFCLICQFSQGMSLRYIFSLGSTGERELNNNNSHHLFLSNFATSLLVVWLVILVKSHNTALKIVTSVLTAVYLIMRNSRWLVLIMVLAPITYYYTKRKKSPKILYVGIVGFLALVVFAWMQLNRYNIAMGRGVHGFGEDGLTLSVLLAPFDSDLTTYTTFYGMIEHIPAKFPFFFGKTFLYIFVLFIPRFIWPTKPDNPVRDMIEQSLGSVARINGRAVSNIGEFYANFGVVGIIILMFLFGYIVSRLKPLYEDPSENRIFIYSILFPLMFQWAARGNFSGNFYFTLFAFVPFAVHYAVHKSNQRRLR